LGDKKYYYTNEGYQYSISKRKEPGDFSDGDRLKREIDINVNYQKSQKAAE